MTYSNRWLYEQLRRVAPNVIESTYNPLIRGQIGDKQYRIYCPSPAEYVITVDIAQRVQALGANTISYAESWSRPSIEAQAYAAAHGMEILPHRILLGRFGAGHA